MTRAESLRILVIDLDTEGKNSDEIARILGIPVTRVERILDGQDVPHQLPSAPAIEPLERVTKASQKPPKAPPAPQRKPSAPKTPSAPKLPKPIEHGTAKGALMHSRRGETPCDECRAADNQTRRERNMARRIRAGLPPRGKPGPPQQPINHGTETGRRQHLRRGEEVCGDCAEGARKAWAARRERMKARAA